MEFANKDPVAAIRSAISAKRGRSDNPITQKVVACLKLARADMKNRQVHIQNALREISRVPEEDDARDLAQKIKNEAMKDINSNGKPKKAALNAVKACDAIIAREIDPWMVAHAGMGVEGILAKKDIEHARAKPKVEKTKDPVPETAEELLLAYAGM